MSALTPERENALVDRLHHCWHPAPNACTENRPCDERRRARGVVRVLGPLFATWLAEDVEQARATLDEAWGGGR